MRLRSVWLWRRVTRPREAARLLVPRVLPLKLRMHLVPRLRRLVDRREGLARGIAAAPAIEAFALPPETQPTLPVLVAAGLDQEQLALVRRVAQLGWQVVEAPSGSAGELRRLRQQHRLRQAMVVAGDGCEEAAAALQENGWRWCRAMELPFEPTAADAALRELYPLVSIVMVTYGNFACTRLAVQSVLTQTNYPRFELIVVDNASTDGTPAALRELGQGHPLQVLENERNEGFAAACNRGIDAARGDLLCLLNNDTIVTTGWLNTLVTAVADPQVGLAGPVSNAVANEARVDAAYGCLDDMVSWADNYTWAQDGRRFAVPITTLFCGVLRRQVWEAVGPLDEAFGVGLFEDHDYSKRLRRAGYDLLVCRDSFVHHWHHATFSRLQLDTYCELYERNRRYFKRKWQRGQVLESAGG